MEPTTAQDLASFVAQLGSSEIAIGGVGGKRQSMDTPVHNDLSPALVQFGLANEAFQASHEAVGGTKCEEQAENSDGNNTNGTPRKGSKRPRSCERKETMKVYMRNYRMRQKKQMESMPDDEKERILAKQRMRVRLRVRRHRLRKKLRASGMSPDEIEVRLAEMAPTATSRAAKKQKSRPAASSRTAQRAQVPEPALVLNRQHPGDLSMDHMNAICLDLPKNQQFIPHQRGDFRQQMPPQGMHVLGGAHPAFAVDANIMDQFRRSLQMQGNVSKLDFDTATHNFQLQDEQPAYEEYSAPTGGVKLSPSRWSVTQVGIFLEGLDLGHLKIPFEAHHIDGQALLDMTAASLNETNFVPQGTRAELLSAISSLKKVACVK